MFVSAKLQLESTYVEGSGVGVRIRSVTENSYLCVNTNGDLTLEVSLLSIAKSSATRFTCGTYLYSDNTRIYICCCSKADSSAMQVGSGWGGWSLFCRAYLRPLANIFLFICEAKNFFFSALYRCMETLWTAACFQKTRTLGTEHFSQCTTQAGISVLNEVER